MPSLGPRLAVLALCGVALGAVHGHATAVDVSGYAKSLNVASETLAPEDRSFALSLNRVRLQLAAQPIDEVALEVQVDNELLAGSYLRTQQFERQRAAERVYRSYASGSNHELRYRWHRAFATWAQARQQIRLGRQRIALGTGRFFSPLDRLNPPEPLSLERREREGFDALLYEHRTGPLSRASAFYARGVRDDETSAGFYWHGNVSGTDVSVLGGRFGGDRLLGVDVASQAGGAGVRAELTQTLRRGGGDYTRALLGIDYAFANTLTLSGELFHDGAGAADPRDYDFAALLAGRVRNVGRSYVAAYASYDITPLLKVQNHLVVNLGDESWFVSPEVTFSVTGNMELTLGVQWYRGPARSEFRQFRDVYFAQAQWFF